MRSRTRVCIRFSSVMNLSVWKMEILRVHALHQTSFVPVWHYCLSSRFSRPLPALFATFARAFQCLCPRFSLRLLVLFAVFARASCCHCSHPPLPLLAPSAAFARALHCIRSHTLLRQFMCSVSVILRLCL